MIPSIASQRVLHRSSGVKLHFKPRTSRERFQLRSLGKEKKVSLVQIQRNDRRPTGMDDTKFVSITQLTSAVAAMVAETQAISADEQVAIKSAQQAEPSLDETRTLHRIPSRLCPLSADIRP